MLSIQPINSAAGAAAYYSDAANYYLSDGGSNELPGVWYGKGADTLQLPGEVAPDLFLQLLQGRLPSGQQLGLVDQQGAIQHRPATDLTLSAPKSFSNVALVGGDKRLIEVHNSAVRETMNAVERLAAEARITLGGKTGFEKTGNLVISMFQHTTSREFDALLHDHCLIMNMTKRADGQWRSLSSKARDDKSCPDNGFRELIYQHQHYLGLIYNSSIAKGTCDIGYDIEVKDQYGNFEIKGVPDAYIKQTSKRRNQIKNSLSSLGFSSAKAAETANLDTRRAKKSMDSESLMAYWKDEATDFGVDFKSLIDESIQREQGCITTQDDVYVSETALHAIDDALTQLSSFNTQIKHRDLVRMAFTFARGTIHHEELEQEISTRFADKRLQGVSSSYYTTKALVEQEKGFIKQFKASMGTGFQRETKQAGMAGDVLRHKDRVQLIDVRGLTHEKALIEELVHTSEAHGVRAYVLHVGRLQRNRLNDSIARDSSSVWKWITNLFKDELVQTVAGFTSRERPPLKATSKQGVVIVHDAQKLSYKDLMALESVTATSQSKLILLNNTRSTEGYSAGSPLKALKEAGFKSIQSLTHEKKATFELTESNHPNHTLAKAFVGMPANLRQTTQVVAHTNKGVETLTELIRAELKSRGELSLQSKTVSVLSTQMLSEVQKNNHKFFEKGDQVILNAFSANQQPYRVVGKEEGMVTLSDKEGREKRLPLQGHESFVVRKTKSIALSIGDALVTEKNIYLGRAGMIERGKTFAVDAISEEGAVFLYDKTTLYFSNNELLELSLSHNYVRKPNQLTQHASTVMTALEGYQINKNLLGELSEFSPRISLFTNDKERAITRLNQEALRWTIHDVANSAPSLVYRDTQFADPVIRKDLDYLVTELSKEQKETDPNVIASIAVAYATAKISSREAAFEHKILLREAMVFALGQVRLADIERAIADKAAKGELIHAETLWISKESLALENNIIKNNLEGQGKVSPVTTNARLLSLGQSLTQGQKDAITLALTTQDRFTTVQGLAGTGKTTMMSELQRIATDEGYSVVGLAPMHSSKDELISSGIQSITIARFLSREQVYPENTLFIVDESSMIGNQSYLALQTKMIALKTRMVFAGDITQLQSPSSGIPHELTVKTDTQKIAYMNEIMRQDSNPTLKKAVIHASNREIMDSFKTLATINPEEHVERTSTTKRFPERSIVTIDCRDKETKAMDYNLIYRAISNDYLTRIPEHQKKTLVIAHAHEDRAAINVLIREGLKAQGLLDVDEVATNRLSQRSLEPAELLSILSYQTGDVLRFDANYSVAKKGDYFTVCRIDKEEKRLHCQSEEGTPFSINPARIALKARMSVYRSEAAQLAAGDTIRLRLTDNSRGRVANKEYSVTGVTKECALLHNEEGSLDIKLNHKVDAHWDYSYTTTAFGAQGLTAGFVLALELAKRQKATTHRSHEIDVTRPREQVTIYTEDEGALTNRLATLQGDKTSAYLANKASNRIEKPTSLPTSVKIEKTPINNNFKNNAINSPAISADTINQELLPHMEVLCERLLGKPNSAHSDSIRYGSKGSLSINLKNGLWYNFETGEKGNALQLIAHEMGFNEFKETIGYAKYFLNYNDLLDRSTSTKKPPTKRSVIESPNKKDYAKKLLKESLPIEGTIAARYLKEHRKLAHFKSADVRFVPNLPTRHGDNKMRVPALMCIARDSSGELNNVQVTRLNALTGNKDYASKTIKQTYGKRNGCPVDLNNKSTESKIYLTEGLETGLSLLEANPKARVMTVLGKENFKTVDLSRLTNHVVFCVDNDGKKTFGDMTIITSALRIMSAGKSVSIICPEKEGEDFNDVLIKEGVEKLNDYMKKEVDVKSVINTVSSAGNFFHGKGLNGKNDELFREQNKLLMVAVLGKIDGMNRPAIAHTELSKNKESLRPAVIYARDNQPTPVGNKVLELER